MQYADMNEALLIVLNGVPLEEGQNDGLPSGIRQCHPASGVVE
jgi:hypothetical protein